MLKQFEDALENFQLKLIDYNHEYMALRDNYSILKKRIFTPERLEVVTKDYPGRTFFCLKIEKKTVGLECLMIGDISQKKLQFFSDPLYLIMPDSQGESVDFTIEVMSQIFNSFQARMIIIPELSELEKMASFSTTATRLIAKVNLSKSQEQIRKEIRRSYRSLINWGISNIQIEKINREENIDKFKEFVTFYELVSGKKKNATYWDELCQQILRGEAFALLGYLDNDGGKRVVSSSYIIMDQSEAVYSLGAYDKVLMYEQNKPLAHWTLLSSIFEAKRLGGALFNLGFLDSDNENPKEKNIFYFKRAFTEDFEEKRIFINKPVF